MGSAWLMTTTVQVQYPSMHDAMTSGGIHVRIGNMVGFTVAIHWWYKQFNSGVKLGYQDYTVKQGDWESGTVVGVVKERIGLSKIGAIVPASATTDSRSNTLSVTLLW